MVKRYDCDIVVVGAGPGGSMAARYAAEGGLDVILLEKKAIVEGLATRLIEKLTVDGPDFEKIYMANGNLDLAFAVAAPAAVPAETEASASAETEEGKTSEE